MGRHAAQRPARTSQYADTAAALAWLAGMLTVVGVKVAVGYASRLARRLGRHAWHLVLSAWRRLGVRGRLEAGIYAALPAGEVLRGLGVLPGQLGAFTFAGAAAGGCCLARGVIRREAQEQWRQRKPPQVVTSPQQPAPAGTEMDAIWHALGLQQEAISVVAEGLTAQRGSLDRMYGALAAAYRAAGRPAPDLLDSDTPTGPILRVIDGSG